MRPTVDEQLAGIDRLLNLIATDATLGDESVLLLRDARRQLGRLRGSLPARLSFLQWDNAASIAVLGAVAPVVPGELQAAIEQLPKPADTQEDHPEERAAETNDRLRELLARALDALPESGDGEAARRRIVEHLRARVDANPALNKSPIRSDGPPQV